MKVRFPATAGNPPAGRARGSQGILTRKTAGLFQNQGVASSYDYMGTALSWPGVPDLLNIGDANPYRLGRDTT